MNCKQIHTVTKYGGALSTMSAAKAEDHVKNCIACRNLLLSERLAPAIIKAASAPGPESTRINSDAVLISRIKRRIQEIREHRSSSWEAAVETMSGWLAAFAVTAILLIAASIQWRPSVMVGDFDLVTQNTDEHLISDAPGSTGASKDDPHANK
jgi:predicted anti-sigma-YlaC factor YlaD